MEGEIKFRCAYSEIRLEGNGRRGRLNADCCNGKEITCWVQPVITFVQGCGENYGRVISMDTTCCANVLQEESEHRRRAAWSVCAYRKGWCRLLLRCTISISSWSSVTQVKVVRSKDCKVLCTVCTFQLIAQSIGQQKACAAHHTSTSAHRVHGVQAIAGRRSLGIIHVHVLVGVESVEVEVNAGTVKIPPPVLPWTMFEAVVF